MSFRAKRSPRIQNPLAVPPSVGGGGDQPPIYSAAVMLVAVLAAWPSDLEPRLRRPNEQSQKIAPLTLAVGNQPPAVGTSIAAKYGLAIARWPQDLEPRLERPNGQPARIAPLTLIYGDQPPVVGTAAVAEATAIASWPASLEPHLERPNNARVNVTPLTLVYGDLPPIVGTAAVAEATAIAIWPANFEPRLTRPNDRQTSIAPLTLVYGDQPPPARALGPWNASPDWPVQSSPRSTAWNQVIVAIPYSTFRYDVVAASWPTDVRLERPTRIAPLTLPIGDRPIVGARVPLAVSAWPQDFEPRLTRPNDRQQSIAPLTLVYGDRPTPRLRATDAGTAIDWPTQTAPRSTAWNVVLATVPYATLRYDVVLASWPTDVMISRSAKIAPLTLVYGQQPPIVGARVPLAVGTWPTDLEPRLGKPNDRQNSIAPLTLVYGTQPTPQFALAVSKLTAVVNAWPTSWDAQTAPKGAAWNVPPILVRVVRAVLPNSVWTAWEPVWQSPPKPVSVATLTLPTGQTPPNRGPLTTALRTILAWPIEASMVPRSPAIVPTVPEQLPAPRSFLLRIIASWTQTWNAIVARVYGIHEVGPTTPEPRRILTLDANDRVVVLTTMDRTVTLESDDRELEESLNG